MQSCSTYAALVPGYVDGELSEEQAAPLRQHLLSCNGCRNAVQDLGRLGQWFPDEGPLEVPAGFAARVAAAAFAGEAPGAGAPRRRPVAVAPEPSVEARILPFVLTLTSVAAGVLLTLALLLAQKGEPEGQQLSAEPLPAILQELERLNAEAAAQPGR